MNIDKQNDKKQAVYHQNIPDRKELNTFLKDLDTLSFHQKIIEKALNIAKELPEVEAVLLLGSLAVNTADIFSDVDFYVLIKDKKHIQKIKDHFLQNLTTIGKPIHIFGSNAYPNSSIVYFKPFIKFELLIEDYKKLVKNWRVGKKAKLLFDRNGLGAKLMKEANELTFNLEKYELEIQNVAIELPSFCYNIAGYMLRGEYITSIDFIAWIRRLLLRICGFFLEMWDEGTRRAELRFSDEVLNYYHQCIVKNVNGIWQILHNILDWYSNWLVPRFEIHNFSHANDEVPIIRYLLNESEKIYTTKK
ncbi:MAG: nucleotidyltransferase domain-containing protein [Promethearchaeota archaeon]|nr:MAG: nucleotidyltransferase domain-containing protein [Candidatus Lokiarchaeota archaeon]